MAEDQVDEPGPSRTTEHYAVLEPGLLVGRYEIVSVLGQGAFGITYCARDTQLDRDVAIKEYLPAALAVRQGGTTVLPRSTDAADDFAWGRSRFLDEARTLARLSNAPAVVRVFDFLEAHGTAYAVMQMVEGATVAALLKRHGRLEAAPIERLLNPLLEGLEQVHAAGFLHRDIKPANIIVAPDGTPTLIDFGAARAAVQGRSQAMTAVFTPGFAAVEQYTSGKQGPWTDIYGMAATLYTCIAGEPPPNAIDRMVDDQMVPAATLGAGRYPPALLDAIDAGMAVKAGDRPQSIGDWRRILTGGAPPTAGQTVVMRRDAPTTSPTAQPAAEAGAGRKTMVLAAVALLLVAAGGGYWAFKSLGDGNPAANAGQVAQTNQAPPPPPAAAVPPPVPPIDDRLKQLEEAEARLKQLEEATAARQRENEQAAEARRKEAEQAKAEADARAEAEAKARAAAAEEEAEKAKAAEAAKEEEAKERAAAAQLSDAEAKAAVERTETALHLSERDRQKLQVALTSLGFATGGFDGAFGPRTRQMIAAWQQRGGQPATGYLTAAQVVDLLRVAAGPVARWEEEQKQLEEQRRAPPPAPAPPPAAASPPVAAAAPPAASSSAGTATSFDGTWSVNMSCPDQGNIKGYTSVFQMTVRNGSALGQRGVVGEPGWLTLKGQIQPSGAAQFQANGSVGVSAYAVGNIPRGSPVSFGVNAQFTGNSGTGTRTQARVCHFTFTKL